MRNIARFLKKALKYIYWEWVGKHVCSIVSRSIQADIAVFHDFMPPPYGGGNQFMIALCKAFERKGMNVSRNSLSSNTDKVIINSFNFNEVVFCHLKHSACRVLHRVDGPISVYRDSNCEIDKDIHRLNQCYANSTVFQSDYSFRKHQSMNLHFNDPHVIHNAVDAELFNRQNRIELGKNDRIRIIAVSWSDNPNKGWGDYRCLAEILDQRRYEFVYLGRAPEKHPNIHFMPPVASAGVAVALRESDIYITASRHESCSNSILEAMACGLPVVYVKSGSNAELVGQAGLGFDEVEEIPELLNRIADNYTFYQENIRFQTMDYVADQYLKILSIT